MPGGAVPESMWPGRALLTGGPERSAAASRRARVVAAARGTAALPAWLTVPPGLTTAAPAPAAGCSAAAVIGRSSADDPARYSAQDSSSPDRRSGSGERRCNRSEGPSLSGWGCLGRGYPARPVPLWRCCAGPGASRPARPARPREGSGADGPQPPGSRAGDIRSERSRDGYGRAGPAWWVARTGACRQALGVLKWWSSTGGSGRVRWRRPVVPSACRERRSGDLRSRGRAGAYRGNTSERCPSERTASVPSPCQRCARSAAPQQFPWSAGSAGQGCVSSAVQQLGEILPGRRDDHPVVR